MAKFEGIKWAGKQMVYTLADGNFEIRASDDKVFAVSRSIHYGLFLAFEGIRFYCARDEGGKLVVRFFNWEKNLERFRDGISFNLSRGQQDLVPSAEQLKTLFMERFFREESLRSFLGEMADMNAQGYLRPFTADEEQSIGVTFPARPAIRAVFCRYDQYLGEPFTGVVIPQMVRAVGVNGTGCRKLGINYLMSVKAVDEAKKTDPQAAAALFLDDNPGGTLEERLVSEWDSSCCLFGLRNGTVVKIPENPLILPSVTIRGITAILREMGVPVEERHFTYGELIDKTISGELAVTCSIGTAGILNRCDKLILNDNHGKTLATHRVQRDHPLYEILGKARERYWAIYKKESPVPAGMNLSEYRI